MRVDDFPAKLALTMKVLSSSRGRLAADLRLDKSVIARWLSGVHAPTSNNLAVLTAVVAARCQGFSILDWERDLASLEERFARLLGTGDAAAAALRAGPASWLPEEVLSDAMRTTESRGDDFVGFWRSTRPFIDMPGRFVRDRIMIRRGAHGLLDFRLSVVDMHFQGVAFPTHTQIFAFCADPMTGVFIFVILNAVPRHRADVMDGLTLTLRRAGGGVPVAAAVLLERTGLLTDDPAADEATHAALARLDPLAGEGSVPPDIAARLNRDTGPEAYAAGGEFLLSMPFGNSMARGPGPGFSFPD